jgi:hypothetical protein
MVVSELHRGKVLFLISSLMDYNCRIVADPQVHALSLRICKVSLVML